MNVILISSLIGEYPGLTSSCCCSFAVQWLWQTFHFFSLLADQRCLSTLKSIHIRLACLPHILMQYCIFSGLLPAAWRLRQKLELLRPGSELNWEKWFELIFFAVVSSKYVVANCMCFHSDRKMNVHSSCSHGDDNRRTVSLRRRKLSVMLCVRTLYLPNCGLGGPFSVHVYVLKLDELNPSVPIVLILYCLGYITRNQQWTTDCLLCCHVATADLTCLWSSS